MEQYDYIYRKYSGEIEIINLKAKLDDAIGRLYLIIEKLEGLPKYTWTKVDLGYMSELDEGIKGFCLECKDILTEYIARADCDITASLLRDDFRVEVANLEQEQKNV